MICGCCAIWLCAASAGCAQATQTPGTLPPGSHEPLAKNAAHPALTPSATGLKHLDGAPGEKTAKLLAPADAATQPATVSLRNGKLTVEANNSDLTQILQDLAGVCGMTINGLKGGHRVFGVYGPGNSREVPAALLVGAGYNFIMVGGASDGTPRELLLISQKSNAPAFTPLNPRLVPSADRDQFEQGELERNPSASNATGPGAISPAPSQDDRDDNTRVQQTLRRLQHIQEQQQNAPQ